MVKCKILWIRQLASEYDYKDLVVDSTDWDEITEEEYKLLLKYSYSFKPSNNEEYCIVIRQDEVPIQQRIKSVREFIEKESKRHEALQAEKARKKTEALIKKQAKDLAEKKKMLEQLKKELGDT